MLSLLYLLSLLLLMASGSLSGALSRVAYALAFLLPTVIGIYLTCRGENGKKELPLSLDSRAVGLFIPVIFPTVLLIVCASLLTSTVIWLVFGVKNQVTLGDNLPLAILSHAILPAVLEEALYRYLPLRLWGRDRGAGLVVISSLCFALLHRDFFVIPYAFLAGALFMIIDIITDSIWPSVILHAVNNTLSVLLIFYSQSKEFTVGFYVTLVILSAISAIFIFKKRDEYLKGLKKIFNGEKVKLDAEILYLAIPTLALAAIGLASKF